MKLSDKFKAIVATVAPTLATALGGPLAGAAVAAIAKGLGVPEEKLEDAVLAGDPQAMISLRQIDNQFATEMKRLDIDLEKIYAGDRASARDLAKVDIRPQVAIAGLMFAIVTLCLGTYVWLLLHPGEKMNEQLVAGLGIIVGALVREVGTIMQFFFGSSSGSKDKTAIAASK